MRLWVIDRRLEPGFSCPTGDAIINFTFQPLVHSRLLDYSSEYNALRKKIKDDYIEYVSALGNERVENKTLKELFAIEGSSLWWFTNIQFKDSFSDTLFDDICKALLIKKLRVDLGFDSLTILTESRWLENLLLGKKESIFLKVLGKYFNRVKLSIFYYPRIKLFRLFQRKGNTPLLKNLFFTFFPQTWSKDFEGNYSDRFLRDLPEVLENSGYLIYLQSCVRIPEEISERSVIIEDYVTIKDVFLSLIDLRNATTYFFLRKKIKKYFTFEGLDLSFVYDWYLWEATLLEECYWRLIIRGVKKISEKIKPEKIVAVGEFGNSSKSVIIGAKRSAVKVVWFQHSVLSKWKLWCFNPSADIVDASGNINMDFISRMPVADTHILWGERTKRNLMGYGYPHERMVVLGNPRYDSFAKIKNRLCPKTAAIVFTPSIHVDETVAFAQLAMMVKKKFPKTKVVIKFHPRYKELLKNNVVSQIIDLAKNIEVEIFVDSVEQYFNDAVVFVNGVSTVGIEAAYFGAKVVTYCSRYYNGFTPDWLEEGTYVSTPDELMKKIEHSTSIPLLKWSDYYLAPGEAKERVAAFINGL